MALGAKSTDLVTSVFRESLTSIAAGTLAGLVLAMIVARSFASLLYSVTPGDPVILVGSVMLLFGVGAVAACIPAWRAARTDPMIALRHE
jgi:putative ABC transport system permease protein